MRTINYPFAGLFEECALYLIDSGQIPFKVEAVNINEDLMAEKIFDQLTLSMDMKTYKEVIIDEGKLSLFLAVETHYESLTNRYEVTIPIEQATWDETIIDSLVDILGLEKRIENIINK